ncbi:MAG TPA: hypothetical protein VFM49_15605 [Chloroflexia bacterium]|jgi:hypothetical protein|nr:hypothetical protein [Chloroflexia bacterium]
MRWMLRCWLLLGGLLLAGCSGLSVGGPTPVPTPPPGLTPAEQAYFTTVQSQVARLNAALAPLDAQGGAGKEGDGYRNALVRALPEIRTIVAEAAQLQAPPRFAGLDSGYKRAIAHFQSAATLAQQGAALGAESAVEHSADELARGRAALNTVAAQLASPLTPAPTP